MKTFAILITLLSLSGLYLFNLDSESSQLEEIQIMKQFISWKSKFGQNFNGSEEAYRYNEFRNNLIFIEQHNQNSESLQLGLTQFAAMSNQEFRSNVLLKNKIPKKQNVTYYEATGKDVPDQIDWVTKGAVYTTQNQGSCGSCWAFATIGGLQGLRQIVTGTLELLSAQQITSCTPKEFLDDKTQGCNGGEPQYAYQYTSKDGIEPASAYPYTNGSGGVAAPCLYDQSKVVFYNEGVGHINHDDVQGMKENIANQPLTIAVDAGNIYFQLYTSGVIDSKNCGTDLNHSILLVGMDQSASTPYWKVQNSWGTGWGYGGGFGNIAITEGNGVCGINMQVDYPTSINQKSITLE